MIDLHDGPAGGHFSGDTTAHKILRAGYYWPHYLRMHTPMSEILISSRGVEEDNPKQRDH